MSLPKYAQRRDLNESEILGILPDFGAKCLQMKMGNCYDATIYINGHQLQVEIKNPGGPGEWRNPRKMLEPGELLHAQMTEEVDVPYFIVCSKKEMTYLLQNCVQGERFGVINRIKFDIYFEREIYGPKSLLQKYGLEAGKIYPKQLIQ